MDQTYRAIRGYVGTLLVGVLGGALSLAQVGPVSAQSLEQDLFAPKPAQTLKLQQDPVFKPEDFLKPKPVQEFTVQRAPVFIATPIQRLEPVPLFKFEAIVDHEANCDRLAAHPDDPGKPKDVDGVKAEDLNSDQAVPACKAAVEHSHGDARYLYQLGRAMLKADKNSVEALQYLSQASTKGYMKASERLAALLYDQCVQSCSQDMWKSYIAMLMKAESQGSKVSGQMLAEIEAAARRNSAASSYAPSYNYSQPLSYNQYGTGYQEQQARSMMNDQRIRMNNDFAQSQRIQQQRVDRVFDDAIKNSSRH